jgi:hypothetical protein
VARSCASVNKKSTLISSRPRRRTFWPSACGTASRRSSLPLIDYPVQPSTSSANFLVQFSPIRLTRQTVSGHALPRFLGLWSDIDVFWRAPAALIGSASPEESCGLAAFPTGSASTDLHRPPPFSPRPVAPGSEPCRTPTLPIGNSASDIPCSHRLAGQCGSCACRMISTALGARRAQFAR